MSYVDLNIFTNFLSYALVVFVDADGCDHDDKSGRLQIFRVIYCNKSKPWKFHSSILKITTNCRLSRSAASVTLGAKKTKILNRIVLLW